MINRYHDLNIKSIWSEDSITNKWMKLELLCLEGWSKFNLISESELEIIKSNIKIDINRWKDIENETKHEFAAFIQMLEETIPNSLGKWLHYGLTSSDILDSASSLCLKETLEYISTLLYNLDKKLNNLIDNNLHTEFCGRTHGQVAEIQEFSQLIFRWKAELKRCIERVNLTIEKVSVIKLSGPVGNYTNIPQEIEFYVANKLELKQAKFSSQIISRDIFADYFYSLAMVASLLEKIATYIRLLSMSGINEFNENFSSGQIGSSAMPHKKNPIICENICGLSRMIKSYLITAIDNNNSWLERDMSHSSIERITFVDSAHLTAHSIKNLTKVLDNLYINKVEIQKNINQNLTKLNSHKNMLDIIKNNNISRKDAHKFTMNGTK